MPWKETTPVAERMQFLVDYRSGLFTVSFLAERHGVSRKRLYKWIARFEMEGVVRLEDQMRQPRWHPNQTSFFSRVLVLLSPVVGPASS